MDWIGASGAGRGWIIGWILIGFFALLLDGKDADAALDIFLFGAFLT